MKYFLLMLFLSSPLFAQIQTALHLDNFDQTLWSDGKEELAFYKRERYFGKGYRRPDLLYRYRILKEDKSYEDGTCALTYAWKEEMPYMEEGQPVTNYFYRLTLTPDKKTPRTALIQLLFFGSHPYPIGFIDVKYQTEWRFRGSL